MDFEVQILFSTKEHNYHCTIFRLTSRSKIFTDSSSWIWKLSIREPAPKEILTSMQRNFTFEQILPLKLGEGREAVLPAGHHEKVALLRVVALGVRLHVGHVPAVAGPFHWGHEASQLKIVFSLHLSHIFTCLHCLGAGLHATEPTQHSSYL